MGVSVSAINSYFSPEELKFINKRANEFNSIVSVYEKYPLTELVEIFLGIGNLKNRTKDEQLEYLAIYQCLLNHNELRIPDKIIDQACEDAILRGETTIDVTQISVEPNLSQETIQSLTQEPIQGMSEVTEILAEEFQKAKTNVSEGQEEIVNVLENDSKDLEKPKKGKCLSKHKKSKKRPKDKTLKEIEELEEMLITVAKDDVGDENQEECAEYIENRNQDNSVRYVELDMKNKDLLFKWGKINKVVKLLIEDAQRYADKKMDEYKDTYIVKDKKRDLKDPNIESGMYI